MERKGVLCPGGLTQGCLQDLIDLPPQAEEWAGLDQFISALQGLAADKVKHRLEQRRNGLDAALRDVQREFGRLVVISEVSSWSAAACPDGELETALSLIEQLRGSIASYVEIEADKPRTRSETREQHRRASEVLDEVSELHDKLASLLSTPPNAPTPGQPDGPVAQVPDNVSSGAPGTREAVPQVGPAATSGPDGQVAGMPATPIPQPSETFTVETRGPVPPVPAAEPASAIAVAPAPSHGATQDGQPGVSPVAVGGQTGNGVAAEAESSVGAGDTSIETSVSSLAPTGEGPSGRSATISPPTAADAVLGAKRTSAGEGPDVAERLWGLVGAGDISGAYWLALADEAAAPVPAPVLAVVAGSEWLVRGATSLEGEVFDLVQSQPVPEASSGRALCVSAALLPALSNPGSGLQAWLSLLPAPFHPLNPVVEAVRTFALGGLTLRLEDVNKAKRR